MMAADLKTTYIQGKMQDLFGVWLERNNLSMNKSVYEGMLMCTQMAFCCKRKRGIFLEPSFHKKTT